MPQNDGTFCQVTKTSECWFLLFSIVSKQEDEKQKEKLSYTYFPKQNLFWKLLSEQKT